MSEELIEETLDVRGDDVPLKAHEGRDIMVKENLRVGFGPEAEKEWRLYENGGMFSKGEKRKDGRDRSTWGSHYVKCPMYVKKDDNVSFEIGTNAQGEHFPTSNFKRCNFDMPDKYQGTKNGMFVAAAHMKAEHFDDWYEVNRRTRENGDLTDADGRAEAPPMSTKIRLLRWRTVGDKTPSNLTNYEKKLMGGDDTYRNIEKAKRARGGRKEPKTEEVENKDVVSLEGVGK